MAGLILWRSHANNHSWFGFMHAIAKPSLEGKQALTASSTSPALTFFHPTFLSSEMFPSHGAVDQGWGDWVAGW